MKTGKEILSIILCLFILSGCSKDDPQPPVQAAEQSNTEQERANRPPLPPSSPVPADGSTQEVFTDVLLSWKSSDPDKDELTFDLYFGDGIDAMEMIAQGLGESQFMLELIDTGSTYLWKVVAKDKAGLLAESKVFFFTIGQKVLTEDVFLRNQQEVNDFGALGYNKIEGDLTIGSKTDPVDINNLTALLDLNKLEGDLEVEQTELSDLNGLSHLTSISGRLKILENPVLQSLEGLDQLQSTGSSITIEGNTFLLDIGALTNLEIVNSDLIIRSNPSLQSLIGLENISRTGLDLVITGNTTLRNLDALENLTAIGETLRIESNPLLVSLEGLSSLTTVELLNINKNGNLTNLNGLNQIKTVSRLVVQGNTNLVGLEGLEGLTHIGGQCLINFNPNLTSLRGLQNVSEVEGDLILSRNNSLRSFDGLEKLISVGQHFFVQENFSLENIKGLFNLQSIGSDFYLEDNFELTQLLGLENLTEIGEDFIIRSNARLNDYCSLNNLIMNGKINGEFITQSNQYNPTEKDMKEGACKVN